MRPSAVVTGLMLLVLACSSWADSPKDANKATMKDDLHKLEGTWQTPIGGGVITTAGQVQFELVRADCRVTQKRIRLDLKSPWGSRFKVRAAFELKETDGKRVMVLTSEESALLSATLGYRFDGNTLCLLIPEEAGPNFAGERPFEVVPWW